MRDETVLAGDAVYGTVADISHLPRALVDRRRSQADDETRFGTLHRALARQGGAEG